MACLDAEKLSKMDCASSVTGFWVGLRIGDPSIWNSVQRGAVTKFTIDVAAKGVEIEFPQPRASAPSLRKKGITKMCDTNELPESVSKALDSESSSREDFELALDDLTKALRKDTETFEAAYNRALMTPVGKRLYSGLDAVSS